MTTAVIGVGRIGGTLARQGELVHVDGYDWPEHSHAAGTAFVGTGHGHAPRSRG